MATSQNFTTVHIHTTIRQCALLWTYEGYVCGSDTSMYRSNSIGNGVLFGALNDIDTGATYTMKEKGTCNRSLRLVTYVQRDNGIELSLLIFKS